jgi:hypothetical protein
VSNQNTASDELHVDRVVRNADESYTDRLQGYKCPIDSDRFVQFGD